MGHTKNEDLQKKRYDLKIPQNWAKIYEKMRHRKNTPKYEFQIPLKKQIKFNLLI